jgi:hypothetical protein
MATPITISAIPTNHARIWGAIRIATPNITNINAGIKSTSPDFGLSVIPLHIAAIGHGGAEVDSVILSSFLGRQATPPYAFDDHIQRRNDKSE